MATSTAEERAAAKVEGADLLGQPTFTELDNGRFRCVETGHEVLAKDKDSYSRTKRCRLGLIDFALSHRKAPLNMFEQDPLSRSKLKCKLTGDTINKTEEHIWKHINGKRFLNKLEQKELEKVSMAKSGEQQGKKKAAKAFKPSKENSKKKKKEQEETISEAQKCNGESDPEDAFWMPPIGQRWDNDDGGDRWGSGSDSEHEDDEDIDKHGENKSDEDKHGENESDELSKRTKRMSIEIGPSSFASRKKKSKKSST
ncbi:surfeit locus protein 2-like isoform X2 [Benincasa hispida]|uniref:surfeit locus protein 2-like isoform X2 n=1 Tax=Benincasa hispida TaxID=102211 RepID=UPI0018FF117D|nr:surfeit locus protein 2-like isoform X2 [Benincasa hispida]